MMKHVLSDKKYLNSGGSRFAFLCRLYPGGVFTLQGLWGING